MRSVDRPSVTIDLSRVRANVEAIARRTGVPVIGVVKADAYGLGARQVVAAIAELVTAFYVFDAAETLSYDDVDTGKPTISMLGQSNDPDDYVSRRIRPAVWTVERATALRRARPVLSMDTGQGRFGCILDDVEAVARASGCDEAMTHATTVPQARMLHEALGRQVSTLHAAGTALLDEPEARLNAVRPGLALYRDAVRVTAPLIEARDVRGPAGYGGFVSSTGRLGVFAAGYAQGMRAGGECLVNGQRRPVPEVGMQSAFVELGPRDQVGDEVVLLGDGITVQHVGATWGTTPHEALLRFSGMGERRYVD